MTKHSLCKSKGGINVSRDTTKTALTDLTPEQLKNIKHDYLYNTKLTLKDICIKWNITNHTYSRLAGVWKEYFDKGLEKPCLHCGQLFISRRRSNTVCDRCNTKKIKSGKGSQRGRSKTQYWQASQRKTVNLPPLEVGRWYKYKVKAYDPERLSDSITKEGKLVQICDHFLAMDNGKYRECVSYSDILNII